MNSPVIHDCVRGMGRRQEKWGGIRRASRPFLRGRNPWEHLWVSQTLVFLRQIKKSEASLPRKRWGPEGGFQHPLVARPRTTLCCVSLLGPRKSACPPTGLPFCSCLCFRVVSSCPTVRGGNAGLACELQGMATGPEVKVNGICPLEADTGGAASSP